MVFIFDLPLLTTLRWPPLLGMPQYASCRIFFWWSIRGSNPGPQCLQFEGITTILYLRESPITPCPSHYGRPLIFPNHYVVLPPTTTYLINTNCWITGACCTTVFAGVPYPMNSFTIYEYCTTAAHCCLISGNTL